MTTETTPSPLVATGEMGARILAHAWDATPLGPIGQWPAALRIAVQLALDSPLPQCVAWGAQHTSLFNDAFSSVHRVAPEALGRALRDLRPGIWQGISSRVARAFAGEASSLGEHPWEQEHHDSCFGLFYVPLRDEHGAVLGVLETASGPLAGDRDQLWHLASDLMVVARFDGTTTLLNPAWQRILGWSEEELLGRKLLELIHPQDRQKTLDAGTSLAAGEPLARFDNRYRHKEGGYRWISWSAVSRGALFSAVGRDVTQERESAEALQQTEELLRHSQKMEAVGQLTGGLAHDFNNLLIAITGSLELLNTRLDQGRLNEAGRYIGAAQGAAQRAAALTHRLLAFSRRQTLDPRPVNINRLVGGMEDLIRRTMGPDVQVQVSAAADLWTAQVDANQLESALLNLCLNARDAMPGGGQLTLSTGNREFTDGEAREFELQPGQYLSLSVTDSGTGMSSETVRHAFEPFFTTKPTGEGTGLGLSMVYGFARQSGGQARIHSRPGQGTTVTLYLPRHQGEEELEPVTTSGDADTGKREGETVMVIDDEPTLRMLIGEVLEDLGYRILEAEDGASGLDILQSDSHIDLLITDVGLPGGMNGRQVADAARLLRPGLKVLFITGYAEHTVMGNGQLESGMQVLTKPFPLEELSRRIKSMLLE